MYLPSINTPGSDLNTHVLLAVDIKTGPKKRAIGSEAADDGFYFFGRGLSNSG